MTSAEFGYTLGTGRLFQPIADFHRDFEELVGRPVMTHEFAEEATWDEARRLFEKEARAKVES